MLKQTVKYTDYNGVEKTEDFLFNLNKAEIAEMELTTPGGLAEHIKKSAENNDNAALFALFKDLILRSYGIKSADGKRFIKSKELREEFSQTEAYSELFIELASDPKKAAAFVEGITPKDLPTAPKN